MTEKRKGGRPRTGSVWRHELPDGTWHWDIQVTLPNGKRSPVMHQKAGMTEARARELGRAMTEAAAREGVVDAKDDAPKGETFAKWAERWCADREARGLASVDTDRSRLRKWINPRIGDKPIASVTKADLEALVEVLDRAAAAHAAEIAAGRKPDPDTMLAWKTAGTTWGLVAKAFKDAKSSKTKALRAREDNPAADVVGPDRGITRAKAYLFPTEALAIAACAAVPLAWRRAIVLAIYTFTRASELRALTWDDVDLERGILHVHKSLARDGGADTSTKTEKPRSFALEPAVLPLLRAMHDETGGAGRVCKLPDDRHLARALRGILTRAGLKRPALFANTATQMNLTWHDLRATGITWMTIRGDEAKKIQRRAGHDDLDTTDGYIRAAEVVADGFGDVFPPLPAELLGGPPASTRRPAEGGVSPDDSHPDPQVVETMVEAPGIESEPPPRETQSAAENAQVSTGHDDAAAEPNCADPGERCDSDANPPTARGRLARALADAVAEALAAGDAGAARVALEALEKLTGEVGAAAPVVDLADERRRRGGA